MDGHIAITTKSREKKVLAPEYGGNGDILGRCQDMDQPLMGFPGHWAPNDLHFYQGTQFPERYQQGAFIAFHGSSNRTPYPQAGYVVCFVPFENGMPTGTMGSVCRWVCRGRYYCKRK